MKCNDNDMKKKANMKRRRSFRGKTFAVFSPFEIVCSNFSPLCSFISFRKPRGKYRISFPRGREAHSRCAERSRSRKEFFSKIFEGAGNEENLSHASSNPMISLHSCSISDGVSPPGVPPYRTVRHDLKKRIARWAAISDTPAFSR